MDNSLFFEDEYQGQERSELHSQYQKMQQRSQLNQYQNNSQLGSENNNDIQAILNQAKNTLDYLSTNPLFTEQNVHNWHAHIVSMTQQATNIAKQRQMNIYLQKLCECTEEIRVKFDLILQNNYPQLCGFLKQLQIQQTKSESEQRKATLCRQFEYDEQVQDREDLQTEFKNYQLSSFQNPKLI